MSKNLLYQTVLTNGKLCNTTEQYSYKVLSGGGLDGNGEPIISTVSWSEPIRCLYKTVKHSNTIYQQGKFTDKSYEILIESRDFQADTVKLTNDRTQFLGEFEVQDIEFVNRSGRVKITV